MNDKTIKRLKWLCCVGLLFCACWLLIIMVHTYNEAFSTSTGVQVQWSQPWSACTFVAYTVVSLALLVLAVCFFINILRGVGQGVIFPKCNIALIMAAAVLSFCYVTLDANMPLAFAEPGDPMPPLVLNTDALVVMLGLLVFGVMYKLGHDLAVENELTV